MHAQDNTFGELLKNWRTQRRLSQLDLGLAANVSARHVSFLETGRAHPSRAMVIQLLDTLTVPHSARNLLLNAAGFAPVYRRRDLQQEDMVHIRSAMQWTLERHDPFPGISIDRHWRLVMANQSAARLLSAVDLNLGDSLLDAFTDSEKFRAALENWSTVARYMITRLQTESAHLGGDTLLDAAAEKLAEQLDTTLVDVSGVAPAVVPARYRVGDMTLSLFSTISQFGSAEDIALADLKIELMFPADDATREALFGNG